MVSVSRKQRLVDWAEVHYSAPSTLRFRCPIDCPQLRSISDVKCLAIGDIIIIIIIIISFSFDYGVEPHRWRVNELWKGAIACPLDVYLHG